MKGRLLTRFTARGGLLLVGLLLIPTAAYAVEGIGISPTSNEIRLQAGQTYSGAVTVINDGGSDVTYTLSMSDYRIPDNTYKPDFNPSNLPASISPVTWFSFKSTPTVLKAHQEVVVPYKIVVPPNATTGGHYAVMFAQTVPKNGSGSAVVNKIVRVGSIFYLATGGDLVERAKVLPPKLSWFQVEEPFETEVGLQNQGNVHFLATGTAYATPLWGKKGPVAQFKGEVLPQTTRTFQMEIPARQPIGIYKVTYTFNYLGHDQPQLQRWVLLVPKLTIFILLSTLIIIVGYFVLRLVNYWFNRDQA